MAERAPVMRAGDDTERLTPLLEAGKPKIVRQLPHVAAQSGIGLPIRHSQPRVCGGVRLDAGRHVADCQRRRRIG